MTNDEREENRKLSFRIQQIRTDRGYEFQALFH